MKNQNSNRMDKINEELKREISHIITFDVKEVNHGYECGLQIENYNDLQEGDTLEVYIMEQVKQ